MDKTFKEQLVNAMVIELVQSGAITFEDLAKAMVGRMVPDYVQSSLFETKPKNKRKSYHKAGYSITLMDSDGKLHKFDSYSAAARWLNRGDNYLGDCITKGWPIYAKRSDGRRGEEFIIWTEGGENSAG